MNVSLDDLKTKNCGFYVCPLCLGKGKVIQIEIEHLPETKCPFCHGRGEVYIRSEKVVLQMVKDMQEIYSAI